MPKTITEPGITIAMPFFNSAATLELSVRSLLNQSYDNFELLLCDDGSHDQGSGIAYRFNDPRVICWSDGRRLGLGARLNECIDRARGPYLTRMDADDIAYPDRLAQQMTFLLDHQEVDLCGGGAMVFGKHGRPLWRFSPPTDHGEIIGFLFLGFPLLHPAWMGRIEWFRRWRYDENTRVAQDQELLLRSYRNSRFANLSQIVLGYREEQITPGGLSKLLHPRYVCTEPGPGHAWQRLRLPSAPTARSAADCVVALGEELRIDHKAAQNLSVGEPAEWRDLWTLLSGWYGRPSSETFLPSSLLRRARSRQWPAC
jgi:glycosyltransferase involved in cell wall biosynthesis